MKNIILENEKHSPQLTGNKATNLSRLKEAGFAVPSFVTILPSAFSDEARWQDDLLVDELKEAHAKFQVGEALLAVRSSAIDEDGDATSFAGQLDSFLNVKSESVIASAKTVWLSGSSERLQTYCKKMGIEKSSDGPAIIVQKMVNAKVAGVAFSADPITGNRATVVINAVTGLADRLVAGEVGGDLFYVHDSGSILRTETQGAKLSDDILLEIARNARKIESLFGCPQDIEWAHDGVQLFILQARPITTLPEETQGDLRIWDNSNIAESYQGVTTPLTFSFAAKAYEHVYIQFCRLMGVPNERIQANQHIFPRMLGFVRGRIYYNLVNWYRLLALLPGFQVNRPFMEQMMGVKEELPAEIVEKVLADNKVSSAKAYLNFCLSVSAMVVRFVNLNREIAAFQKHFNTTVSAVPKDLRTLSTDQLVKTYRGLEGKLLTSWDAPLVNDFFAMIFFGLLGSLSQKWFPSQLFSHPELLVHSGGIISTEPARLIAEMAAIARDDEMLRELLKNGSLTQIERVINENHRFGQTFKNYLEMFGDRCFNELKLESPTLKDNPLPLLRNIGAMASMHGETRVENKENLKAKLNSNEQSAKSQIAELPWLKRSVFNFVANQAIERIRWRENLRFERTRLFGLVRRLFLEVGKRFEKEGILNSQNDIFYLEVEEVLNFVEGKSTTSNLTELAELRKRESQEFKLELPPPNRIVTRNAVIPATPVSISVGATPCVARPENENQTISCIARSENAMQGLGCSPGIVRGRVRVVRDPASAKPLEDEILIAERTDPGWIVLFTQAKGIIVEYGSLLSHTAIVSRELGIPAIVSAA
ncbi:MAG: phosphoenolpyruvate synthase, partial [Candidatus Melainabacteria bacterium]|nr:phosphoenolpyruvate synthase [Candidatus Melainabacteria bacterium]